MHTVSTVSNLFIYKTLTFVYFANLMQTIRGLPYKDKGRLEESILLILLSQNLGQLPKFTIRMCQRDQRNVIFLRGEGSKRG